MAITYSHENVLKNKCLKSNDSDLKNVLIEYNNFRKKIKNIKILNKTTVLSFVNELNIYRSVAVPIFESRANSGQENLRSTILEELFQHLFFDLAKTVSKKSKDIVLGKANSYVSMSFTPKNANSCFEEVSQNIHTKNQDFVIGVTYNLQTDVVIEGGAPTVRKTIVVPLVAIECKTYLERNMLDSCAATAMRLKGGMPYCKYIVASEYLKMADAAPELTEIDEVYILCKATNSDREKRKKTGEEIHLLDPDLIYDLFCMIKKHFNRIWWNPSDVASIGKVINRE